MPFISTRGGMQPQSFSETLLEGLAPDGGLAVPDVMPEVDGETLERWRALTYPQLATEVLGLFGETGAGRGVDAGDEVDSALDVAARLAERTGGAVAVSGEIDAVVSAESPTLRIANGHQLMTKVTGVGCALGAIVAAYLPVARTPHLAAAAATAALTVAAEEAARRAAGPGSFAVELLDALARVDSETVTANLDLR